MSTLGAAKAPATVAQCHRITSAVMRAAVRNRVLAANPCDGVRLPRNRRRDTADQIITREQLRESLLPELPRRYRGIVATAGGAGLRWGEAAGLCWDAVDLDRRRISIVRTVVEVSGRTTFKPYPKSAASQRTVPIPAWLAPILVEHRDWYEPGERGLVFGNSVGKPLRRTLFRSRVWRPALVRAGLLGKLTHVAEDLYRAEWPDGEGGSGEAEVCSEREAIALIDRSAAGGLRFHDLRHSYATWLVDDGVPVNMVQRVMGHEKSSTTLDLYTRRTDDHGRILEALADDDEPAG